MEYLVTDIRDLRTAWIAAATPREALIAHENRWRKTPLAAASKASDYSQGDVLDVSLGESAIRGRSEHVVRDPSGMGGAAGSRSFLSPRRVTHNGGDDGSR